MVDEADDADVAPALFVLLMAGPALGALFVLLMADAAVAAAAGVGSGGAALLLPAWLTVVVAA